MSLVDSLPAKPLTESALSDLESHEKIESAFPMMATGGSGRDEERVYQFVLETESGVHALVLSEDGDGWESLDDVETVEDAMFAIQSFQGGLFGGGLE